MALKLDDLPRLGPVIPVIVIDDARHALPMALALLAGGIRVLEITLRTNAALDAIKIISSKVPDAVVGAGTVLNANDARRAQDAGAQFVVSPGYNTALGLACRQLGLPLLPGVTTTTEIMTALDDGLRFLKLFPAEAVGGIKLLKSWASPFGGVGFCPTGGITPTNAQDYLAQPNVRCIGGSWLTPADALRTGDWSLVTKLAREAAAFRKL